MQVQLTGLEQYQALIGDLSGRRVQAAVATAVTRTAVQVRNDAAAGLRQSLSRPTPYTQRQLRFTVATADNPVAAVGFNVAPIQDGSGSTVRFVDVGSEGTPAGKYLTPNVQGGTRRWKGMEVVLRMAGYLPFGWFAVPGSGARLDTYGNVARTQITQMLQQLQMQTPGGLARSVKGRGGRAALKRAGGQYFVIYPGGRSQPGVYLRGAGGRSITPVFIFVRSVRYLPRYRFDQIVERTASRVLPQQVARALREQIDRAARAAGAQGVA